MIREQWLCTTLYSGKRAGSIGFSSGLCPNVAVDDGRVFMGDGDGDACLRAGICVGGVLVASLLVHDVCEAHDCEARGKPCVWGVWACL